MAGRAAERVTPSAWRALVARPTTRAVRADRIKQLLKNGVYRAIGETATGVGAIDGERRADAARAHVPQGQRRRRELGHRSRLGQFDEQMAQLGELGYRPVSLDEVIDHYADGAALPPGRC